MLKLLCISLLAAHAAAQLPTVSVTKDDTVIKESCVIEISEGLVIEDANDNGVIQIGADNIVVRFAPKSVLRGCIETTPGDRMKGVGIRAEGHSGVTLIDAKVRGFKVGILGKHVDGLVIEGADCSSNFRQHLKSTPEAEDAADWLYPHNNDNREWVTNYGAGICVERSKGIAITRAVVTEGQNGILLDRVEASKLYVNECTYLSGWGIALWRSCENTIARNKLDYCVRGYSHGVYNRGQDSAGLLLFEQSSRNVIAENSATHCGDGLFGFAGREAIGEGPAPAGFDPKRAGCNDNLIIDNEFSYCVAHGLELTFSFGNKILRNKFTGDAICGIWAGYSQETLIAQNRFEECGDMAYGMERGGVNIEHGAGNLIIENTFRKNACGVHLWWDDDKSLLESAWAKANHKGVTGNTVCRNLFEGEALAFQLRDAGSGNVRDNSFFANTLNACTREVEATRGSEPVTQGTPPSYEVPSRELPGKGSAINVPVLRKLAGRQNIVISEWGPWNGKTPLIWRTLALPASHSYELRAFPGDASFDLKAPAEVKGRFIPGVAKAKQPSYMVTVREKGVFPYTLKVTAGSFHDEVHGILSHLIWSVAFFKWDDTTDPRTNLQAWRNLGSQATHTQSGKLDFNFGMKGPSELDLGKEVTEAVLPSDRFGTIASTQVRLPKGRWKISTLSDDGVRVLVDGKAVIENWNWHAPTKDSGEFAVESDGPTSITVEHFELDGYSVLKFDLTPVP